MAKTEKLFSDELERLVCSRNRYMEFIQSVNSEDVRITNIVLYQSNLIYDKESLQLPESQMRLYAFLKRYDAIPFDAEEDLTEYVRSSQEPFQNVCAVDYLGDFAGRTNVVKITYLDGRFTLCTATRSETGVSIHHDVLNAQKSKTAGAPIWEVDNWGLKTIYEAFRSKGVIPYENDPYTKTIRLNRALNKANSGSGS